MLPSHIPSISIVTVYPAMVIKSIRLIGIAPFLCTGGKNAPVKRADRSAAGSTDAHYQIFHSAGQAQKRESSRKRCKATVGEDLS